MPNNYFKFQQFTIEQSDCAMKVGTDGVLLGAWVEPPKIGRVLDVGTGTGLISLMLAQRSESIVIDAVEIDQKAAEQARHNILQSPWTERIHIYNIDFFNYQSSCLYHFIICNPPFYRHSPFSSSEARDKARSHINFSMENFIHKAVTLLETKGTLAIILPISYKEEIDKYLAENRLFINRICNVQPVLNKPVHRILLETSFEKRSFTEEHLIIEYSRHQYSKEYINLTSSFYLNLI